MHWVEGVLISGTVLASAYVALGFVCFRGFTASYSLMTRRRSDDEGWFSSVDAIERSLEDAAQDSDTRDDSASGGKKGLRWRLDGPCPRTWYGSASLRWPLGARMMWVWKTSWKLVARTHFPQECVVQIPGVGETEGPGSQGIIWQHFLQVPWSRVRHIAARASS